MTRQGTPALHCSVQHPICYDQPIGGMIGAMTAAAMVTVIKVVLQINDEW
jgi:hypothetical protein